MKNYIQGFIVLVTVQLIKEMPPPFVPDYFETCAVFIKAAFYQKGELSGGTSN